eukprot:9294003-Pyramimonas_sp.AAC.1
MALGARGSAFSIVWSGISRLHAHCQCRCSGGSGASPHLPQSPLLAETHPAACNRSSSQNAAMSTLRTMPADSCSPPRASLAKHRRTGVKSTPLSRPAPQKCFEARPRDAAEHVLKRAPQSWKGKSPSFNL